MTLNRIGFTNRPVVRASDVDFDLIPSPKPRAQPIAIYGPGPSNLSNPISRRHVKPGSDSPHEGGGYDDVEQDNVDMDVDGRNGRRKLKKVKFQQIDQDDDEEEEDEPPEETPKKNTLDEANGRAIVEEDREEEEEDGEREDIMNGLEDVEQEHDSDDEEEEEEPEGGPKGKKVEPPEETKPKPRTETRSRGKKENKRQFFYSQRFTCQPAIY